MEIKFAVWGVGVRGKNAIRDLGNKVICIIESNEKFHDTYYNNIPIVSFDKYISLYAGYPVIITPFGCENEIRHILMEKGISNIFNYYDCQDLIKAFCIKKPIDDYIMEFSAENKIIIYKKEILGCLLYNYLLGKDKLECAQIILEQASDENEELDLEAIKRLYKEYYIKIMKNLSDFYYNPQLERVKDIHHGQRCFVVATGPSLQIADLDKLHKNREICFSINGIFAAFDSTAWRPDYYMVADLKAALQWKKEILEDETGIKFVSVWAESELAYENEKQKSNMYTWYAFNEHTEGCKPFFSENFARGTSLGWTITYNVLQLAVYMGFSEIYLLGVDCNYKKGSHNNHFNEEEEMDMLNHNEEGMIWAYRAAEEYTKSHEIKIYNATRGGMLEVFERVDFDSLFE